MDKIIFIVCLWMEFFDKWEQSYFVKWKFPENFLNENESIYVVPSRKYPEWKIVGIISLDVQNRG